jgi:phage terminase large subunit
MTIEGTRVFRKLWQAINDKSIRGIVLEGGSRSSKTWSICQAIYITGLQEPKRIAVARLRRTWIKPTVLDTFKKVLQSLEVWEDEAFNKTDLIYSAHGSTFEFYGLDDSQKLHGIETDYFWLNEAIETSKDDFDQLEQRCKGKWILDYNPSTDQHWIYDSVLKREDVVLIHSTMLDNPYLEDAIISKIKSYEPTPKNIADGTADLFKWQVYGLGERARREGVIYTNWTEADEMPEEPRWTVYGLDFGFTHDPTALVKVSYQDGKLWTSELIYETGLTNADICERMEELGLSKGSEIIADSAEPKSIEEIRRRGWRIRPVTKGQDSVRSGIDKLKQYPIRVHKDSINVISELRNYSWKKDYKTNRPMNKPEDENNHCFVGSTKIITSNGDLNIRDVSVGDMVLTSNGFRKVLKKWNNGVKKTIEYTMHFDTFSLSLRCTPNHKIKTNRGWIQIDKLLPKDKIYLSNGLMVKDTNCTMERGISAEVLKDCIGLFGSFTKERFQKVMTFITLMATVLTMKLRISILSSLPFTREWRVKRGLKRILSLQEVSNPKELRKLKNGTKAKMEGGGIQSMVEKHGLTVSDSERIVSNAEMNMKHLFLGEVNTAITTARLKHLERGERENVMVYDLTVEGQHEYFANGVLVHNCLDALRYVAMMKLNTGAGEYVFA